jgi:FAD/FMN-containing dehydrogenase
MPESLTEILGPQYIKSDAETLSAYAVDGVVPRAVVFPEDQRQVSEVVQLAGKDKLALVPWGSGSKMAMGNAPVRLDLVVCTRRLNRVIDLDTANLTLTLQAGVRFKDIQYNVGECFIPMSPPYNDLATLGGIIAANSAGPTRLLYGLPRDLVLGVNYVAPNGEIVSTGGKTVKNVSGYDMCKLMIGSQGTLGIVCGMTLRLLPLPERLGTCLSAFATLTDASGFVDRIFETSLLPAAVEILNWRAYELLRLAGAVQLKTGGYATAVAFEGFHEPVDRMTSEISHMASESGAEKVICLQGEEHRDFWNRYSNLVPALSRRCPDLVSLKLNYPISKYPDVIQSATSLVSDNQIEHALLAHAGTGIAWIHLLVNHRNAKASDRVVSVSERLLDRCQGLGGNLVIERAVPDLKGRLPIWGLSREDLVVMRRIKQQMDPLGLFCPGRFVGGI